MKTYRADYIGKYGCGLIANVRKIRIRKAVVVAAIDVLCSKRGHLFRFGNRWRPKSEPVNHAENRGICPNAERDGQNADGGEAGGLAHHAEGIVNVLKNAGEQTAAAFSQRYGLAIQITLD